MILRTSVNLSRFYDLTESSTIICFTIAVIGTILCFAPFYLPEEFSLSEENESSLQLSVQSDPYQLSIIISVVIAAPILVDTLTDLIFGTRNFSCKIFYLHVRFCLLVSYTLPSILLAIPAVFEGHEGQGYLSMECIKRISTAACILAFIGRDNSLKQSGGDSRMNIIPSSYTIAVLVPLALGELLWLYSYFSVAARCSHAMRISSLVSLSISYLLLLYISYLWVRRMAEKQLATLGRCFQTCFTPRKRRVKQHNIAAELISELHAGPRIGAVTSADSATSLWGITPSPAASSISFLSRDICINTYLAVMIIFPIGKIIISYTFGSRDMIPSLHTTMPCDVYFEAALFILALVVPGRCEQPMKSNSEKVFCEEENFVTRLSAEVGEPLSDLLGKVAALRVQVKNAFISQTVSAGADEEVQLDLNRSYSGGLRDLLASVRGGLDPVLVAAWFGSLSEIKSHCQSAISRLEDLSTLEGLHNGRLRLDLDELSPVSFFDEFQDKFQSVLKRKNISYELHVLGKYDNCYIHADKKMMYKAFLSIFANAVGSSDEYGSMLVTVTRESKNVRRSGGRSMTGGDPRAEPRPRSRFSSLANIAKKLSRHRAIYPRSVSSGQQSANRPECVYRSDLFKAVEGDYLIVEVAEKRGITSPHRMPTSPPRPPNFKSDSAKTQTQGALGLAFLKGIIELHGGVLRTKLTEMTREEGPDRVHTLYLPLYQSDPTRVEACDNGGIRAAIANLRRASKDSNGLSINTSVSDYLGWFVPDYVTTNSGRIHSPVRNSKEGKRRHVSVFHSNMSSNQIIIKSPKNSRRGSPPVSGFSSGICSSPQPAGSPYNEINETVDFDSDGCREGAWPRQGRDCIPPEMENVPHTGRAKSLTLLPAKKPSITPMKSAEKEKSKAQGEQSLYEKRRVSRLGLAESEKSSGALLHSNNSNPQINSLK